MSASDDIDPKALDVAQKRRRRRRRDKAAPSAELQAQKPALLSKALSRPLSPGIMFEMQDGRAVATSPHHDEELWELSLASALGTRSISVMRVFVNHLRKLCAKDWDEDGRVWKPNETEVNACLAIVGDVRPRNVAEAALAAQMCAVHLMTMRLSAQALNNGHMVMDRDAAIASKLARTYVQQLEALRMLRGKSRTAKQSIHVTKETHQHVHYHRGADANSGQPQDTGAATIEGRAALSRDQPGGEVVRLPRRSGPRSVP